ncbi:hypothetical protein QBC40DRAFT_249425 [Triangularia verruculosa]|uniref:Uncharacterized protein n=1 Tax=Triangularia verruculosa TaxID=2587418 RepID=A0AAN6XSR9_9PEZI|nr:hypothetical protein QBC40DRAFT_249425 [Triangularia verruculosa]
MASLFDRLGGKVPSICPWFTCLSITSQVGVSNVIEIFYRYREERQGVISFTNHAEIAAITAVYPWAIAVLLWLQHEPKETLMADLKAIRDMVTDYRNCNPLLLHTSTLPTVNEIPCINRANNPLPGELLLVLTEHAKNLEAQILNLNNRQGKAQPPSDRGPVPQDLTPLAEKLFDAIVDERRVINGTRRTKKGTKLSVAVERLRGLSDVQIGIMAWDLAGKIAEAHHGDVGFSPNHQDWWYEEFPSLDDRLNAVIEVLETTKSSINMLQEHDFARRIAAAPQKELVGKISNFKLNSGKATLQTAAIQAIGNGQIARPEATSSPQVEALLQRVKDSRKRARVEEEGREDEGAPSE